MQQIHNPFVFFSLMDIFSLATNYILVLLLVSLLNYTHGTYISKIGGCDVYQGNWIYDSSYPLYDLTKCPFIQKEFDCQKNGRPDKDYQKYRWQPKGCNLPRFDGKEFLLKYKGKRIMFVGDSLSLNQWQSLTCMLHVAVPEAKYTSERNGSVSIFTFPAYDVSIMFFRNAFLVDLVKEKNLRVMKLDSITSSSIWGGMDVLIFDTWHWWLHSGRKQPWDIIQYGSTTLKDMNRLVAYDKALNTWAKWIDSHIDSTKTKVFFQGISPDHDICAAQKQPLKNHGGSPEAELILEKVLHGMTKPVHLLNINGLSQFRIDGHPSVYGLGGHRGMDCTHWCLPGVPDTWNQLLFAALV